MRPAWAVAAAAAGIVAGWLAGRLATRVSDREAVRDTVTVRDTVRMAIPAARDSVVTGWATAWLPLVVRDTVRDTVRATDSVLVAYPREQRAYSGEDWEAWVSGYRPRLDSLHVVRTTRRIETARPARRWHIGVQAGIGAGRGRLTPYVGLGLTYSLWSF